MPGARLCPPVCHLVPPSRRRSALATLFTGLGLATLLTAALGLCSGSVSVPFEDLAAALTGGLPDANYHQQIIVDLRLPRVLLALLVGASLACAGAAMQGLFRNPLADPGLVGVASGAAFGAVMVIVLSDLLQTPNALTPYLLPIGSFAGGLAAAGIAIRLSRHLGETRTATLLLAGLAINAITGAGIGLLIQVAGDTALREATFWLFGSLSKVGWTELAIAGPILLAILIWLPREARALNILLLGEAEAAHLGVPVERFKRRVTTLIVLAVAASVALAGVIGFVGLIVPHLLRLVSGADHRILLPASALAGGILLTLADVAARTAMPPAEVPIGILTALIGGPFFLFLLVRLRGRTELW